MRNILYRLHFTVILFSFFCFTASWCVADTVTLNDGRRVSGTILENNDSHIIMQRNDLRVIFPVQRVKSISNLDISKIPNSAMEFQNGSDELSVYWSRLININEEFDQYIKSYRKALQEAYQSADQKLILGVLMEGLRYLELTELKIKEIPDEVFSVPTKEVMINYHKSLIDLENLVLKDMQMRAQGDLGLMVQAKKEVADWEGRVNDELMRMSDLMGINHGVGNEEKIKQYSSRYKDMLIQIDNLADVNDELRQATCNIFDDTQSLQYDVSNLLE